MAILDIFKNLGKGRTDSAKDAFVITPNDSTDLAQRARGIYIGGGGDLEIITPEGNTVVFVGVFAGSILPLEIDRVKAALTTATNLVALV